MKRISVNSSGVVSVGYDVDSEILEVLFTEKGVYRYFNVPRFLYERLAGSKNVDKFIGVQIEKIYPYLKMDS